jgi:hypothetical protein
MRDRSRTTRRMRRSRSPYRNEIVFLDLPVEDNDIKFRVDMRKARVARDRRRRWAGHYRIRLWWRAFMRQQGVPCD